MSHDLRFRSSRRTVALTPEHLADLPALASCVAWQVEDVRRLALSRAARVETKADWVRTVSTEWGTCGHVVLDHGVAVAGIVYAPSAWLPGLTSLPTAPVSPDAVAVVSLYVDPERRGRGLTRLLVQTAAAAVVSRRDAGEGSLHALEAFADTRGGRDCEDGTRCLLPVEVWERLGFTTQRAHPTTPRLRLDVRTTTRWAEAGAAWGRFGQVVRPRPIAETPRAIRSVGEALRVG